MNTVPPLLLLLFLLFRNVTTTNGNPTKNTNNNSDGSTLQSSLSSSSKTHRNSIDSPDQNHHHQIPDGDVVECTIKTLSEARSPTGLNLDIPFMMDDLKVHVERNPTNFSNIAQKILLARSELAGIVLSSSENYLMLALRVRDSVKFLRNITDESKIFWDTLSSVDRDGWAPPFRDCYYFRATWLNAYVAKTKTVALGLFLPMRINQCDEVFADYIGGSNKCDKDTTIEDESYADVDTRHPLNTCKTDLNDDFYYTTIKEGSFYYYEDFDFPPTLNTRNGLFSGGRPFLRTGDRSMPAGTVGEGIRFHHLLRSDHPETVPASDRVQDEEGAPLGRQGHRSTQISLHHDVISIRLHGSLHIHQPKFHAGRLQFVERNFLCAAISVELAVSTLFYISRIIIFPELHPDLVLIAYFIRTHCTVTPTLLLVFVPKFWYQQKQVRSLAQEYSCRIPVDAFKEINAHGPLAVNNSDVEVGEVTLADMSPDDIRAELKRLYMQLEIFKNKTICRDNPHISKRRGANCQTIAGIEECDERNETDHNLEGHQIYEDDGIIDDDNAEDGSDDDIDDVPHPSHSDAFNSPETDMKWFEKQSESSSAGQTSSDYENSTAIRRQNDSSPVQWRLIFICFDCDKFCTIYQKTKLSHRTKSKN
ncbi:g-protein coupled receptor [Holotrichia oblita]|uniref:G-protein coupled receptor n=1 Tax=Holotrichia oblita TaxID=644536 RepID=A0ACB9TBJ7_HOLOL|nr:g-protein coupled receptor [Holotrichia oblita]